MTLEEQVQWLMDEFGELKKRVVTLERWADAVSAENKSTSEDTDEEDF